MTVSLTFAGVLQAHLERVMGMSYMDAQDQLGLFYLAPPRRRRGDGARRAAVHLFAGADPRAEVGPGAVGSEAIEGSDRRPFFSCSRAMTAEDPTMEHP